jgi:hypothetical protein
MQVLICHLDSSLTLRASNARQCKEREEQFCYPLISRKHLQRPPIRV